ncbi:MAG: response regulator [Leptolyngbya sp. SIO4C1]|nr:response regulator [Leptolyngbya sp. SIO4C1]
MISALTQIQSALLSGGTSGSILIVDDDEDNLLLMSYALETLGLKATMARTGREAIVLASQQRPTLMLIDIVLPDVNGIDVLTQLRRLPQLLNVPAIAVTALARAVDREQIFAAGFTDYLAKPYMLEDLNRLIQQYL